PVEIVLLLAAGGVAFTSHAGKAGTRVATASVGGHFLGLGIILSLIEDVLAFLIAPLALVMPLLILGVVALGLAAAFFALRAARRRRRRLAA
ncbi:MAG: DUF4126 family protein, partial [Acidobacteria bacterium]